MLFLIPFLCVGAIAGGVGGLLWWDNLSHSQKVEADALAVNYARELFGKTVRELSDSEANRIHALVKRHYLN